MNFGLPTADLPVVTCAGSPGEQGERHGEALRGLIADGLGRWAESIASTHGSAADDYITGFVQGTDFLPAIRRWTPGLLDEIEGIARGSAQPWEWIYASNLLDEEWTWASERKAGMAPVARSPGLRPTAERRSWRRRWISPTSMTEHRRSSASSLRAAQLPWSLLAPE